MALLPFKPYPVKDWSCAIQNYVLKQNAPPPEIKALLILVVFGVQECGS